MSKPNICDFRKAVRKMFKDTIDDVNIPPSQYPIIISLAMKGRSSRQRFEIKKIAKKMFGIDAKSTYIGDKLYGAFIPMVQNSDGSLTPIDELGREVKQDDIIVMRKGRWDTD